MPAVTPCLWFGDDLEEAMEFYVGIFPNSSVDAVNRFGASGPGTPGAAFAGSWTLDGQGFRGLGNVPAGQQFTEAISLSVSCRDQAEVDHYWDSLVAGGVESQCGWLKDRFGVSWQIVPNRLSELLGDPDPARSQAALRAMLGMRKILIADLEAAADDV